jgi:hypothetical protein
VVNYKYITQRKDVFPFNIIPTLTRAISVEVHGGCAFPYTIIYVVLLQL